MGCEEKHEPRKRLPALLALLPSLLPPLGICNRGGKGQAALDLGRSNVGEDTMQEQCRGQGRGGAQRKKDWESELLRYPFSKETLIHPMHQIE
jgi:hypothetical protein